MRFALLPLLMLSATAALAEDPAINAADLIANPAAHIGQSVILKSIRCVNPSGPGFICAAVQGQKGLRVEAGALGPWTDIEIARKLIGPCKGIAKLESPACTFRRACRKLCLRPRQSPDPPRFQVLLTA